MATPPPPPPPPPTLDYGGPPVAVWRTVDADGRPTSHAWQAEPLRNDAGPGYDPVLTAGVMGMGLVNLSHHDVVRRPGGYWAVLVASAGRRVEIATCAVWRLQAVLVDADGAHPTTVASGSWRLDAGDASAQGVVAAGTTLVAGTLDLVPHPSRPKGRRRLFDVQDGFSFRRPWRLGGSFTAGTRTYQLDGQLRWPPGAAAYYARGR